jgi:hypothetical protein
MRLVLPPSVDSVTDSMNNIVISKETNAKSNTKAKAKRTTTNTTLPEPYDDNKYMTFAEQVIANIKEWYRVLGKPVPKEDLEACEQIKKEEEDKYKEIQEYLASPYVPPKAQFGSADYWKAYWEKKRANGYVSKKDALAKSKKESTAE